ncbi:AGAP011153-PA, partial [Anopheles gambiae str. PEST]
KCGTDYAVPTVCVSCRGFRLQKFKPTKTKSIPQENKSKPSKQSTVGKTVTVRLPRSPQSEKVFDTYAPKRRIVCYVS